MQCDFNNKSKQSRDMRNIQCDLGRRILLDYTQGPSNDTSSRDATVDHVRTLRLRLCSGKREVRRRAESRRAALLPEDTIRLQVLERGPAVVERGSS